MLNMTFRNYSADRSRLLEGDMKRTQRLSIEIQHREVVIAVPAPGVDRSEGAQAEVGSHVGTCGVCGSPWITVALHGSEAAPSSASSIYRALEQAGIHLQVSATGELNICRKSLEDLKEKP
jgi:hypothetical protein